MPRGFQKGHKINNGKKLTDEHKRKIGESRIGEKNPQWKGNKVKKVALHNWVRRRLLKPEFCEKCQKQKSYDLANKSGKYLRDLSDWEWLCRRCHMKGDGRLKKFVEARKKRAEKSRKNLNK